MPIREERERRSESRACCNIVMGGWGARRTRTIKNCAPNKDECNMGTEFDKMPGRRTISSSKKEKKNW